MCGGASHLAVGVPASASRKVYMATSKEALLDRPPPSGTEVATTASKPLVPPGGMMGATVLVGSAGTKQTNSTGSFMSVSLSVCLSASVCLCLKELAN